MQSPDSVKIDGRIDVVETPHAGADPSDETPNRRRKIKFSYPSGSQPLSGYTIKRGVGFGGFGEVYYATSDAGKEVALKKIQRNLEVELRGVRQCLNLKHPNLVELYDIRYDDQDQAWVVMEYVAGDSLQDVIERYPSGMPIDQVAKWFTGLAHGIGYLHDNGIVHRDVKPGNIFIERDVVKIGDYGLAKFISCSRRSGQTESVGTFHYMAPEIGLGKYGKEIDVYAMGILLFEMLTGRVPYDGESSQEIIMKHLTAEPDLQMLPSAFRSVIKKALNKDPNKRYRSAEDMLADLPFGNQSERSSRTRRMDTDSKPILAQAVVEPTATAPEEPIAKALKDLLTKLGQRWNSGEINTPTKIVILLGIAIVAAGPGLSLLPMLMAVGVAYAIYYVIWYLALSPSLPSTSPPSKASVRRQPHAARAESTTAHKARPVMARAVKRSRPKPVTKDQVLVELQNRIGRSGRLERTRDLTGSLLMSSLVTAVLSIFAMLIGIQQLEPAIHSWGPNYIWMALSSAIGAWAVMIASSFWKSSSGDQALRRFAMIVAGLIVGACTYSVAEFLMLEPSYVLTGMERSLPIRGGAALYDDVPVLYDARGVPRLLAYMGYFGALFGLVRFWRLADRTRPARFRLFPTLTVLVCGVLLHSLLPIPKGFLIATMTAIAVQLSSPWIDNTTRKQVQAELEQRQLEQLS